MLKQKSRRGVKTAMDERKQRVLSAIVSLYANDGEPVSSNLLRRYFDMAVSSATLRNEMAALTKLGLLEQPHTSAGRVPSMEGYRYYIENLMGAGERQPRLPAALRRQIDEAFEGFDYDPERLAKAAAKELAHLTGFTAVATTPKSDDVKVAYFHVVQVGRCSAAVLSVNSVGGVATRVALTQKPLTTEQVEQAAACINRRLRFVARDDVDELLKQELWAEMGEDKNCWPLMVAAVRLLQGAGRGKVYVEGEQNLLSYPEMEPNLRGCLDLLNRQDELQRLISPKNDKPMVLLGDDMPGYRLPGVALAAKRYLAGGGLTGAIALMGPSRMEYTKVIPTLEYFSAKLCQAMTGAGKEE